MVCIASLHSLLRNCPRAMSVGVRLGNPTWKARERRAQWHSSKVGRTYYEKFTCSREAMRAS
jgi:hypothetical protein